MHKLTNIKFSAEMMKPALNGFIPLSGRFLSEATPPVIEVCDPLVLHRWSVCSWLPAQTSAY